LFQAWHFSASIEAMVAHKALLVLAACVQTEGSGLKVNANPIRRVVTMLQQMTNKIVAEGAHEKELFEKFMCYCKTGKGDLEQAISDAETKIPRVSAAIKELGAGIGQLQADIDKAKSDRADAKKAVAEATNLRAKEAGAYAKTSSDYSTNLAALDKAIKAIGDGMAGAFLQTTGGSVLRQLSVDMDMSAVDRDVLSSFLSGGSQYAPQSGQILGILKQMRDTMAADAAAAKAAEEAAIKDFDGLVAAKEKQINALQAEIEDKTARVGDGGVKLSQMKEDLEDTE